MGDLDDTANHLADLVVEEGLALDVEVYQLDRVGVLAVSHQACVAIDIHEVVR